MRTLKEMSGSLRHAVTYCRDESGITYGGETYGDIGAVVVAGVMTCRGGGNTVHRAKGARRWMFHIREAREMRNAGTVPNVLRDSG